MAELEQANKPETTDAEHAEQDSANETAQRDYVLLDKIQARVVGALIEKQHTTPDYYPMTLNALTAACNQKSNREPVMTLAERQVLVAMERLRFKAYGQLVNTAGSRANKYGQILTDALHLETPQVATLCVLLLRGAQTAGEIRGRTGRIHEFESIEATEAVLESLIKREGGALVVKLPRQQGRKESRYMHLLCGEPDIEDDAESDSAPPAETARLAMEAEDRRVEQLEQEVQNLRQELDAFKAEYALFRKQFE